MSVETNPHNYTNMNSIFSQFLPARNSPKENSGASGGFLPKPLLLRLRHPNSKKSSRVFCEILSPKNCFRKTSSALVPPPAQKLLGRTPKRKMSFPYSKKSPPRKYKEARTIFSFWCCRVKRGGGGAFVERTKNFHITTARGACAFADVAFHFTNFENRFGLGTINTPE